MASNYPKRLAGMAPRLTVQQVVYRELKRRSATDPNMTNLAQVVRALVKKAVGGDTKAASLLFDRMDGKSPVLVAHARIDELHGDRDARAAQAAALVDQLRSSLGVAPESRQVAEIVAEAPAVASGDVAELLPAGLIPGGGPGGGDAGPGGDAILPGGPDISPHP